MEASNQNGVKDKNSVPKEERSLPLPQTGNEGNALAKSSEAILEISILRLITLKTRGYKPEDIHKLIETLTDPKRLWLLGLCLIILAILSIMAGEDFWQFLQHLYTEKSSN